MKYYYITFELGDRIPDYDFVVRAKSFESAKKKASKIIKTDYPEAWEIGDFSCVEVTAEQLLERMTLN